MMDYSKSKVYKIVNDVNDEIYVGSTTLTLKQRLKYHIKRCKAEGKTKFHKAMREIGIENFHIKLLKKYTLESRKDLLKREEYWRKKLKPTLNTIQSQTTKEEKNLKARIRRQNNLEYYREKDKQKYAKHKDKILENAKVYYKQNKEEITIRKKQYYESTKQETYERNKRWINTVGNQPYECECGMTFKRKNLSYHLKTKTHLAFVKNNN